MRTLALPSSQALPHPGRNSSRLTRRDLAVIVFAVVGIAVASHLAAYQIGWTQRVWDPAFGSRSSALVLHSKFSDALPVSDAAVGAVAYGVEAVLATVLALGASRRASIAYAFVVAGAAGAALLLSALQLFVIRHLCSLCLASAMLSLSIAALALPGAARQGAHRQ